MTDEIINCWLLYNYRPDDYYVPASAPLVLGAFKGLLEEDFALTIMLAAIEAEAEAVSN